MKFYITGSTRGLGKYLAKHFDCVSFNKPFDLKTDIDTVCNTIENGSIVILNAHANQLEYVKRLKDRCKLVVMGSIATVYPDPNMPEYSSSKLELEEYIETIATHSPVLYLRLTSSSYKNYQLIANSIEFWLENQEVTFIGYNVNE
jgi:hypothetical protein